MTECGFLIADCGIKKQKSEDRIQKFEDRSQKSHISNFGPARLGATPQWDIRQRINQVWARDCGIKITNQRMMKNAGL